MISILGFLVVAPFYLAWLLFCAVLGVIGLALPQDRTGIDLVKVKDRETVCKVLNFKGLLSDEEYSFETNEVASRYDDATFSGYLLILGPIIFILKRFDFLDSLLMALVKKWMTIHGFEIDHGLNKPPGALLCWLAATCVAIAQSVGRLLDLFKRS